MSFFTHFFSSSRIGLDIQPHELRLIKLKKLNKQFILETMITRPLAPTIFVEDKIKQWDALAIVLAELAENITTTQLPVAIQLPMKMVRMQHLTLPALLSAVAIEMEIMAHLQRDLPGMTDTLAMDFYTTPAVAATEINVFFAATRQAYLTHYMDCLQMAGLPARCVDIDMLALLRAVRFICDDQAAHYAIAYITRNAITLIKAQQQEILFYQVLDNYFPEDQHKKLLHSLQQFFSELSPHAIYKKIICGTRTHVSAWKEEIIGQDIRWITDIFSYIEIDANMNANIKNNLYDMQDSDFFIALGLAMHEIPRW